MGSADIVEKAKNQHAGKRDLEPSLAVDEMDRTFFCESADGDQRLHSRRPRLKRSGLRG